MMVLLSVGRKHLQFRLLSGKNANSCELITRAVFTITPEASGLPFTVIRRQYPVIPAYCLSVHKAQGQSIVRLGVVFESDPFTHGQLYVALSRVAGWSSIVAHYHGRDNVKNCVLRHLLQ
jgi:ATP-dependent DNA helicase PIF1